MWFHQYCRIACAIFLFAVSGGGAGPAKEPLVVVLANRNVPESVELAQYYMAARNIPAEHLCVLDLPSGEQMARHHYSNNLREPLLAFMRERGLIEQEARPPNEVDGHQTPWITTASRVDYVVSMYGVPLRVGDTRFRLMTRITDRLGHPRFKNMAAVDSELALLLAPPYDISGPLTNPLHHAVSTSRTLGPDHYAVVAARLDGPDPDTVRRMIDDTLFAERYGLLGRMYFDTRGLKGGPYYLGDYWIREAQERFLRLGYETVIDSEEEVWDAAFPMEHAVLYMGWYEEHVTGPFTRGDFRFQPGALAYHIHSSSAVSLRKADRYWAAPLLAKGAVATMGAVSEPFLQYTPNLQVLSERLAHGYSFGDAVHMANSVLSWQIAVIGDPLFRPFRYSVAEQLEHLKEDERPEIEWAHIRHANLLIQQGRFNVALSYLRARLREGESLVIRERLGDLYALNELYGDAGKQYEKVIEGAVTAETAVRVGARWMGILRWLGHDDRANALRHQLKRTWGDHPTAAWLDKH